MKRTHTHTKCVSKFGSVCVCVYAPSEYSQFLAFESIRTLAHVCVSLKTKTKPKTTTLVCFSRSNKKVTSTSLCLSIRREYDHTIQTNQPTDARSYFVWQLAAVCHSHLVGCFVFIRFVTSIILIDSAHLTQNADE